MKWIFLILVACQRSPSPEADLSEIKISSIDETELKRAYGNNCEQVGLKDVDEGSRCSKVAALLSHFALAVQPKSCQPGKSGTSLAEAWKKNDQTIDVKLLKGCDYSIALKLGDGSKAFLAGDGLLKKETLEVSPVVFSPKVNSTADGITRGFPGRLQDLDAADWDFTTTQGDSMWKLMRMP